MDKSNKESKNTTNSIAISNSNIRNAINNILERHLKRFFSEPIQNGTVEKPNSIFVQEELEEKLKSLKITRIGTPPSFHFHSIFKDKPHPLEYGGII